MTGRGVLRGQPGTDVPEGRWPLRPRLGQVRTVVLATCLVLSLLGNVWLGVRLFGQGGTGDTSGRIRLAFADEVREQEVRTLLLSLRATIIRGPSPQGVYLVQVPLSRLRLRGTEEPVPAESMRLLLEELRMHPAVRLAEPVSPAE